MPQVSGVSILPLLAVLIPALAAVAVAMVSFYSTWWRNFFVFCATLATLVTVICMYPAVVLRGHIITFELFNVVSPLNLTFRVDGFSLIVALISSFVWLAATIFAFSYMEHEENRGRFYTLFLLTLSGTVGVPLAGDFLSLLLFFEIMSLSSYVLVVHTQTDEAYNAGDLYLYLGVAGGMSILSGLALLYYRNGTLAILPGTVVVKSMDIAIPLAAILMIVGFGIKAGMAPLHIWLPRAHPVAPAPASALLSGIMIKTGAYGIIRVINVLLVPAVDAEAATTMAGQFKEFWQMVSNMGYVIIWVGICTMFLGVILAIIQDNIKKMLACSSISQMGFILVGIGVAGYLKYEGAMGMAGASYHIINHAVFKSSLFLAAGVIAYKLGDLNMYNLGGLWKKLPFTTLVVIIASLGIAGVPFFNGYTSKTLLHHALAEAYEHYHAASLLEAERIFMITAAGTVLYYLKFIYLTFLRKPPEETREKIENLKGEPRPMKIGMAMLALTIIFIGFNPNYLLDKLIVPSLSYFVFDPHFIEHHIVGIQFFNLKDISSSIIVLGLGALAFAIGVKTGLFKTSIPYWLGQEFLATQLGKGLVSFWNSLTRMTGVFVGFFASSFNSVFRNSFQLLQRLDYRPGKSDLFRAINLANIDFDVILMMFILVVALVFLFYLQFGVYGIGL
ncbi:MAG: proton-conducting membrane transporter [Dethiobacter sp.]|nr:MAG: proton-conducting membrane transporter [Dethiobacter sp.]